MVADFSQGFGLPHKEIASHFKGVGSGGGGPKLLNNAFGFPWQRGIRCQERGTKPPLSQGLHNLVAIVQQQFGAAGLAHFSIIGVLGMWASWVGAVGHSASPNGENAGGGERPLGQWGQGMAYVGTG